VSSNPHMETEKKHKILCLLNICMTITVFVGDSDTSIADRAKDYDHTAYLVDFLNFEKS
jgi:AmiR/NasT family two-component response regulator